jgi:hypothetical protein
MKCLGHPEGAGPHLAARANTVWPEGLPAANLVLARRGTELDFLGRCSTIEVEENELCGT